MIPRITPTDADRAVLQAQLAAHAAVITGPETAAPAPQPPGHPAIGTAAAVPPLVIPTGGSGHHGAALEGTQTAIVSPAVPQEALPPCTAALAQAFAECLAQLANDEECGGDSVYAILKTIEKMKDSRNLNTHRVLKGCSECRVDMEMICYAKDPVSLICLMPLLVGSNHLYVYWRLCSHLHFPYLHNLCVQEENSVRTAPDVCLACGTSRPELQNGRVLCCAFAETRLQTLMNYFEKHDLPIAAPPGRTDEEAFKAHLETIFPLDLGINKISGVPSPLANPEDVVGLGPIPLELLVNELELALRNTEEYRKAEASIQAAASKEAFDEHKKAKHIGDHDKEEAALRRLAKETVEGSLKGKSYNPKNKKQPYFQGNLSPTTACSEVMRKQWVESSNIRQEGRKMVGNHLVNFASWSILVLIGTVGAVTPLHLDWTSAANVAFAVTGAGVATVNLMMPLAEWIFIHPSAIPAVNTWLKEKYKSRKAVVANGLRCGKDAMPVLQEKQFEDLQRFCGVGANGVPLVRKLYQYHGDWIHFLPGYLHQVITLQPCVKFAWDVYELAKFPAYIAVWRDLIAQFTAHPGLPADYSNSTPT